MCNIFRYGIICVVVGNLVASTTAAGIFGSLLGENDNNNNNNPSIPLIGNLGIGTNKDDQNRLNKYNNNNGLISLLGGNTNANKPNANSFNNLNRYPNVATNKPATNVNDLKNQMKDAEKLLERLKELNRLKEQQKLEKAKEQDGGSRTEKPESNNHVNTNEDSKITNGRLKTLTKKKFFFIVKPVVPENEAAKYDQTVYYAD